MNKDKRNNIQLLGTLNNSDESGIIANANQIYDANEDKSTQDVSKEHTERIETLETKENSMQTTLENISKTGEASAASNVTYNHSDSKLDATNVQQAVDEVRKRSNYNDGDTIIDFNTIHLITDNPEFVCVAVDVNEKILYGIKTDGQPYFGVGCPQQVKDYIDKQINKILSTDDISSTIDSLKEIEAFLKDFTNSDTLKKLLDLKANVDEVRATTDDIYKKSNYNDGDNIIDFNTIHIITDNPEFTIAVVDINDRILYGIKADGQPCWGVGVPKVVRDYVDKQVNDILGTDNITETIAHRDIMAEQASAEKCKMQKSVGKYYFPTSFSVGDASHARAFVDCANSKFGKSVRFELFGYTQDKSKTDGSSAQRTPLTLSFSEPIEANETLSFWINVQHKYIAEPFRYASKEESLTLDANGKKQQSLHSLIVKPYLNGVEQTSGVSTIPISNFQNSVSILSNTSGDKAGWGYKTPKTLTDIVGWKLQKINRPVTIKFDRIDIILDTYDYYPNMEINIGHIVTDQKMMPMLCITTDGNLYNDKSRSFAQWCIAHNIPRSAGALPLSTNGLNTDEIAFIDILKNEYANGRYEATQYNRDVKLKDDFGTSIKYLNGEEGYWTGSLPYLIEHNYITRPCISVNSSLQYLDEIIVAAEKYAGFKILRGGGDIDTGGTSYIDKQDNIIYCGNLCGEAIAAITSDNYDTVVRNRIAKGKESIDKMIQLGESRCTMSHYDEYKEDILVDKANQFAEALEEIFTYAKEKEAEGKLLIVTMDKLYELNTNN